MCAKREDSLEDALEPIAQIIRGFPLYFFLAKERLICPGLWAAHLAESNDRTEFRRATHFLYYAIMVSFLLLIPPFLIRDAPMPKLTFFLRFLQQFALYGTLLYLALKMLGAQSASVWRTFAAYAYTAGLFVPMSILIGYPVLFVFAPRAVFGTANDVRDIFAFVDCHSGLKLYLYSALGALTLGSTAFAVIWFSRSLVLSKGRVLLALILVSVAMTAIQVYLVNPVLNAASSYFNRVVEYIS